jgi:hypothetical protein
LLAQQMQQQKLLHGHHHGKKDSDRRSSSLSHGATNASLHRFSVDALAGTGSNASGKRDLAVTSDDDSINSWDADMAGCSEDEDDIDVDDVPPSPTAASTTSGSSRGTSPSGGNTRLNHSK